MYYTENNAWTWNFSVQQDIPKLIELLGGEDKFVNRLDALFNETPRSKWMFMGQFPDATGLNGMFVAGNEPSMHIPYLYNYAGKAWKTQRRVREVFDMWFDDKPLGIPGDEDGGGLCSWYVFSAMGFFRLLLEVMNTQSEALSLKILKLNCPTENHFQLLPRIVQRK